MTRPIITVLYFHACKSSRIACLPFPPSAQVPDRGARICVHGKRATPHREKPRFAADALNHRLPSLEAIKDGLRRRWFGRSEAASPQREASGRSFDFKKEGGPCLETGKERGSED
jgi:hypothetical protein